MRKVLEMAALAGASPVTVLLSGETGTGKELVARIIHRESPRRRAPFVAINCAALLVQSAETLRAIHSSPAAHAPTASSR